MQRSCAGCSATFQNSRSLGGAALGPSATSHRVVRLMKQDVEPPSRVQVRSSLYFNHLVEQDHRKGTNEPDRCWDISDSIIAVLTLSEIELAKKIKNG